MNSWVSRRGMSVPLYQEITIEDQAKFFKNFRLLPKDFDLLLQRIEPSITKQVIF